MKKFIFFFIIIFSLFIIYSFYQQNNQMKLKDGVFIHVTHGIKNPHSVLMALNLAEMMAEDNNVILYFDVDGVEVLLKDAVDLTYSHSPTSHTQIKKLMDMGIKIMACPGCLRSIGKTPDDLREGIILAGKDKFFSFTPGRILTMNY